MFSFNLIQSIIIFLTSYLLFIQVIRKVKKRIKIKSMDKKRKELNKIEWKTKNKNKLKIIINAECVFFIS